MKEIAINKKLKVIKLFLAGESYDEITVQVGVSRGSVVNIIDEFRDGNIPVPPGMTEYIDELRHLVVDLKKHGTSVGYLKSLLKLHIKLQEMGVGSDKLEQWLDICQGIASNTVANNQFVQSALEFAEVTSKGRLSYKSLIEDYSQKSKQLQAVDNQIQQKSEELSKLKHEIKEEKEKATGMLDSVSAAIATAQDNFEKQKKDLKSQLDQYLAQHQLSWKNVNTVLAILNTELGKAGFNQQEMDELSHQIVTAGSLYAAIKQLEHQRDELQSDVNDLAKEKDELNALMKSKKPELVELNKMISDSTNEIRTAYLILSFLIAPEGIKSYDIDTLVRWMVAIRQKRLGIGLNQVKDSNGNIICKCDLPTIYSNVADERDLNIDDVREKLAMCLMPLVKDKFVSKFEYDAAQFSKAMSEINKKLLDLQL